jgi:hypothetical protein
MITRLDELMTLDEVLEHWPDIFTRDELKLAARTGRLPHFRKSARRLLFTERGLRIYVDTMGVGWEGKEPTGLTRLSSLADIGSEEARMAPSIATGMTSEQEESAAELLAQRIMRRPKKRSLKSSSPAPSRIGEEEK